MFTLSDLGFVSDQIVIFDLDRDTNDTNNDEWMHVLSHISIIQGLSVMS